MKRPLHIIIDSADKLGKTTQCMMLSKQLHIPYVKMPNMPEYIKKDQVEEFSKLFNEVVVQFKKYDFVMDRGYTSSLVYSRVFDRGFDLGYISEIEELLDPTIIILTGKPFDADDQYTPDEVIRVDKEFRKLAAEKKYHLVDVTGRNPDEVNTKIRKLI